MAEVKAVHNPWRGFIENCMTGDNYFRGREYRDLIADLDRLYAAESALAALRDEVSRLTELCNGLHRSLTDSQAGFVHYRDRAARLEADNARLREVMAQALDSIECSESGTAARELRAALAEKEGGNELATD